LQWPHRTEFGQCLGVDSCPGDSHRGCEFAALSTRAQQDDAGGLQWSSDEGFEFLRYPGCEVEWVLTPKGEQNGGPRPGIREQAGVDHIAVTGPALHQRSEWHRAAAAEGLQHSSLCTDTLGGGRIVNLLEDRADFAVVLAALNSEGTLSRSRRTTIDWQICLAQIVELEAQTVQARRCEHDCVIVATSQLCDSSRDIAAQIDQFEIWTKVEQGTTSPER